MWWGLLCLLGVAACTSKSWDGTKPLICSNNKSLTVKDCKADLPGQVAIRASNNCQLTLERCTINADTAIAADNNVTIHLIDTVLVGQKVALDLSNNVNVDAKGGRIEGGELAMRIDNHVHVALAGTPVTGAVKRENTSFVDGLPALDAEQAAERLAMKFGPAVCELALGCYGAGYLGPLAGRFTVELDASGVVTAVQFEGEAPESARACLTSAADKRVAGFSGPKGRLQCAYSGTIGPSRRRMDRAYTFLPM